jgi:hypothetical protein
MAEKEIKCKDCGKECMVQTNTRYPRKYCDKCSLERKKAYEDIHLISIDDCED